MSIVRYLKQSYVSKLPYLEVSGTRGNDLTEFAIRISALDDEVKRHIGIRLHIMLHFDNGSDQYRLESRVTSGESIVLRFIRSSWIATFGVSGRDVLVFGKRTTIWVEVNEVDTILKLVSTKTLKFAPTVTAGKILKIVYVQPQHQTCARCIIL